MSFETSSHDAQQKLDREAVSQDINELVDAVNQLPTKYREQIRPALDKAIQGISRRRRILKLVQDALGQLRMDMKYLVFDLEATRRERDEFRRQIEEE